MGDIRIPYFENKRQIFAFYHIFDDFPGLKSGLSLYWIVHRRGGHNRTNYECQLREWFSCNLNLTGVLTNVRFDHSIKLRKRCALSQSRPQFRNRFCFPFFLLYETEVNFSTDNQLILWHHPWSLCIGSCTVTNTITQWTQSLSLTIH